MKIDDIKIRARGYAAICRLKKQYYSEYCDVQEEVEYQLRCLLAFCVNQVQNEIDKYPPREKLSQAATASLEALERLREDLKDLQ